MSDKNLIQVLEWDTNFFGVNIGKCDEAKWDESVCSSLKKEMKRNGTDCVYIKLNRDSSAPQQTVCGTKPVDTKVTYECDMSGWSPTKLVGEEFTKEAPQKDREALNGLSDELSTASRFWIDEKFRPKVAEMYRIWVEKIVADKSASVLITRDERGKISGFVTCKEKNGEGHLDLIVVSKDYHGQGIGKTLMEVFMNWMKEKGIKKAVVVTQEDNAPARHLYECFGFKLAETTDIFHIWK